MILIAHRINSSKELSKIPLNCGVELDLRDFAGNLVLQHNPFLKGEKFGEFLKKYKHNFIILNIKSERIEFRVLKLLKKYKIKRYFFLDSSFPMIRELIKKGEKNIAIRVSDEEDLKTAINLKNKIKWIWFETQFSYKKSLFKLKKLKRNYFKICIVSPDLHKKKIRFNKKEIAILKKNKLADAVCLKLRNFKLWS